jgi:CrcB protein
VPEHRGADGLSPHHPGEESRHHRPGPTAAIAAGGALGTIARYGVERAVGTESLGFPWATFAVNVAGSFILAVVVTLVADHMPDDRWLRPFAAAGFCGGFTTFSTFALEIDQRARHGHFGSATAYLAASLVAGIGAALVGSALVRPSRESRSEERYASDGDLLSGYHEDDAPGGTG